MIKNFRYNSSWEDFEKGVNILKELLESKKAYWLIGYMSEFGLGFDDDVYDEIEKVEDVIYSEIMYLLFMFLEGTGIDEKRITDILSDSKDNISDEEIAELVKSVSNKYELVRDAFEVENLKIRYNMKNNSVSPKVSDFKYNVMLQKSPNGDNIPCALINIASKKKLEEFGYNKIEAFISEKELEREITFICDADDIDIIISQLERVKQKLKEG